MRILTFLIAIIILLGCQDKNQSPTITITSPTITTFQKGENISVSAEAFDQDGFISSVGFLINDSVVKTCYNEPYNFTWNTAEFTAGKYRLSAFAVDDIGYNSSETIIITIEIFTASVVTDTISEIKEHSAIISGDIADNGGSYVTEKGICWSTTSNPEIDDNKLIIGEGIGDFIVDLSGLESNRTYHIRAYAINEAGISYGEEVVFKTLYELEAFTDSRDGIIYNTVKVGDQWWFAENLAYLPNVTVPTTGSVATPYNYVYNQTSCGCLGKAKANENYKIYGTLYNWKAAENVCPVGWHLPDDSEWEQLAEYISDDNEGFTLTEGNWETVGRKLKSITKWGNEGFGTDDYGLNCLPGGIRDSESKEFIGLEFECYFWSATETDENSALCRNLNSEVTNFFNSNFNKSSGYSVRCVKD